jgi:hypothetical protein
MLRFSVVAIDERIVSIPFHMILLADPDFLTLSLKQ